MYKKLCFLVLIIMEIRQGKAISINWFLMVINAKD